MSTRATIQIINNNELVLSEYIGMDGFPTEAGLYEFIQELKKTDLRVLKTKVTHWIFEKRSWVDFGEEANGYSVVKYYIEDRLQDWEVEDFKEELGLYDPADNLIDWAYVVDLDSSKLYIGDTCFDSKTPFETTLEELKKEK